MRPAGLGGSKSLQDLFTDRKVPRALRHSLPVVESERRDRLGGRGGGGRAVQGRAGQTDVVSLSASGLVDS